MACTTKAPLEHEQVIERLQIGVTELLNSNTRMGRAELASTDSIAIRRKAKFQQYIELVLSCMPELTEDDKNIWRESALEFDLSNFQDPDCFVELVKKLISENSVTEDEIKWVSEWKANTPKNPLWIIEKNRHHAIFFL